jgi:hypothetical protein
MGIIPLQIDLFLHTRLPEEMMTPLGIFLESKPCQNVTEVVERMSASD